MVNQILFNRTSTQSFKICSQCHRLLSSLSRPLSLLFYGSDRFSLASLEKIVKNERVKSIEVVTGNSNSPVAEYSLANKLPLYFWPDHKESISKMFDVGLVVSFGHLIPLEIINRCRYGVLNVHGSLLPRWRGASTIHHAILNGDHVTGITIMRIQPHKFDVGDIVMQAEYKVPRRGTTPEVYKDLAVLGADVLVETLQNLESSLDKCTPQPKQGITRAPKPTKEDGFICFERMSATEVDRRVRAMESLVTVYTEWINNSKLKLFDQTDPEIVDNLNLDTCTDDPCEPGSVLYHRKCRILCFKCSDDKWVAFGSVSPHGRKRMSALAFFNGFMNPLIKNNCHPKSIKIFKHVKPVKS